MSPLLWVCRLVQIRTKYNLFRVYVRARVRMCVRRGVNEQRQKNSIKKIF